jgi:gamma-tubulin complex component 4
MPPDGLQDYFLLARGDFWQCFLVEAGPLLSAPPRATADADINIPFNQSALKSTAADDRLFGNLAIRYPQTT